ncbi:hypothetical protein [Paenibacillus kribbensis]|nr:hypothetical protein [Paenibacillus kribbensis]
MLKIPHKPALKIGAFKAGSSVAVHLNLEKRSVRLCRGILTF